MFQKMYKKGHQKFLVIHITYLCYNYREFLSLTLVIQK